jgi:glutamate 5-kinase
MANTRSAAANAKRIVVKVGSSVLTRNGAVRPRVFRELIREVAALVDAGRKVAVVSSGAIAVGAHRLGWDHPGRSIPEKQAAAAVGQIGLVERYRRGFVAHGLQVGQVLLTRAGLQDRERYLNARHTLLELWRRNVVPIVNENDTVSTEEIRFGDNDNLSATVVNLVGADLLVLLTDVDGLYPGAPGEDKPYGVIGQIDAAVESSARGSDSAFGRGGMQTKLEAARTAIRSGAACAIANGSRKGTLLRVAAGEEEGTLLFSGDGQGRMSSRKHWLAYTAHPLGVLEVDAGAARALRDRGRSLLPAGITAVRGEFGIGDAVTCSDPNGAEIARGLVAYASADVARICGLATPEISRVLGYSNGNEVIHRDDLVLLDAASPARTA